MCLPEFGESTRSERFGGKQPMKRHLMRMLIGTSVLVGGLISDVGVGAAQAQHFGGHRGGHGGYRGGYGGWGYPCYGYGGYGGWGYPCYGYGGYCGGYGGYWGGYGGHRGGRGGCRDGDAGLGQFIPLDVAPDLDSDQE